jgi:OOP family OmpA-OmpF porin
VGLQIPFGGKEETQVAMVDPDSDGDGVPDSRDNCPGTPAGVSVDGSGCPLDSDGDGVPDYLDKCPGTPSGTSVDEKGCPLDSDGDGVLDANDQCPGTPPGTRVDSRGCEIQAVTALEGVEFGSDSSELTAPSKISLDATAAELARHPDMRVEIAGHTSSTGPAEYNQMLSERRAQSVADYLISKGLDADRFTVKGYGESEPIADNATREGRARNRRVEMRILN